MARFTTSDGISLHFDETGDASSPPLLCLPGLTRNGGDFRFVLTHLSDWRVIRLDFRGRGQSDRADPVTYQIPVEARDTLELLDHLGIERAAILGTSRGGLVAMTIAAFAKDRLTGVCLNDVGPVLEREGLEDIADYIGIAPKAPTLEEAALARASVIPGFKNVSPERWLEDTRNQFIQTEDGLKLSYDPALRDVVLAAFENLPPDIWPVFDALDGLPLALIRGANSGLLSAETAQEMARRRPDMIYAEVPDRGHVPFLDETEALAALRAWKALMP